MKNQIFRKKNSNYFKIFQKYFSNVWHVNSNIKKNFQPFGTKNQFYSLLNALIDNMEELELYVLIFLDKNSQENPQFCCIFAYWCLEIHRKC